MSSGGSLFFFSFLFFLGFCLHVSSVGYESRGRGGNKWVSDREDLRNEGENGMCEMEER